MAFQFLIQKKLVKLGLTESESVIYTSVLKLGECSVKDISQRKI